ncbi:protein C19orf12 homolog [Patiria miniata]|uniref:Uncharacterized protein n=1 Tax=Patiria miniata TaxID=46514 RepID=A0A914B023_PATMI|nr:protein C19orf12 homolog [Patiria miniata]
MPVSPDNLIKVLIEVAEEKNGKNDEKRKRKSWVVAILSTGAGAGVGAAIGAGVGAIVGCGGGLVLGGAFAYWNRQKLHTVPETLKPLGKERKKQLLDHFKNHILDLGSDSCDSAKLRELLMGDSNAKERTINLLKGFFENVLLMDVHKFTAFQ